MARGRRISVSAPISGGGTVKPPSWGTDFPGRGGDTGKDAFFMRLGGLHDWLRSMEEDLREALDEAEDALHRGLTEHVLKPSNAICPIDTGALRASGWVGTDVVRGRLYGAVGYDTDYALEVHENLDMPHKPPTRAKFLEEAFVVNAQKVADDVLRAVAEALG